MGPINQFFHNLIFQSPEAIDYIIAFVLFVLAELWLCVSPMFDKSRKEREEKRQRRKEDSREFKTDLKDFYRFSQDIESSSDELSSIEDELDEEESSDADSLAEIRRKGAAAIEEISAESQKIRQKNVKELLVRISEAIQTLVKNAASDPNDISATKAFFRKYLEPTCKLAHSYASFSNLKKKNAEVEKGMANIEAMLRDVADALEMKLVTLHQNDVLDIESDISVMRTMLTRDGLMEDENSLKLRAGQ